MPKLRSIRLPELTATQEHSLCSAALHTRATLSPLSQAVPHSFSTSTVARECRHQRQPWGFIY
eukprot:1353394-Prorocentrum_lima.AAC.1